MLSGSIMASRALSTAATNESVIYLKNGSSLRAVLNRPSVLNSLNLDMIRSMKSNLVDSLDVANTTSVVLTGNGKGFCAGGDIKEIWASRGNWMDKQAPFFIEEYVVDYGLAQNNKKVPHVSIWNGAVMGGGVGISISSEFRVSTEKTAYAMPETAIGLIPDVGGSYYLPKIKLGPAFGKYLGLTGARLNGIDTLQAGLATHYTTLDNVPKVLEELSKLPAATSVEEKKSLVSQALQGVTNTPAELSGKFRYASDDLDFINSVFSKGSMEDISSEFTKQISNLRSDSPVRAVEGIFSKVSPASCAVTLEMLKRGESMSLEKCFHMELGLVKAMLHNDDFYEGVRALLIDRDNKPTWSSPTVVQKYFDFIGQIKDEETKLTIPQ